MCPGHIEPSALPGSPYILCPLDGAQCHVQHGLERVTVQILRPVLESRTGACSWRDNLPSCTTASMQAHTSGVLSAVPPVPCVFLTGQRPRVLNLGQIGHSQWEARRTEGGDVAIKAISNELARRTKTRLIGAKQTSFLWALFCSPLRWDGGWGTYVENVCSLGITDRHDSWRGYLVMPPHENNSQMEIVTSHVERRDKWVSA